MYFLLGSDLVARSAALFPSYHIIAAICRNSGQKLAFPGRKRSQFDGTDQNAETCS